MDGPLRPEALRELTVRAKAQLRGRMKALRTGHSPRVRSSRSERIVQALLGLSELKGASGVALFWPMLELGEVDLRVLDEELRKRNVKTYYPFMDPRGPRQWTTGFRRVQDPAELGFFGGKFRQPGPSASEAKAGDVDVVLVPALAADTRGHRLGYGSGFYDATLGDLCPPALSIVVVYDFGLMAELPVESHDRACDLVVTDERMLRV